MGEITVLLPWVLVALLAIVVIVVVVLSRRGAAKAREREAAQAESHRSAEHQRETAHGAELRRRDDQAAAASAELTRYKHQAARRIEHELVSRAVIVSVCEELKLDGVLATNVAFVPAEANPLSPFLTQIDHVLLTDTFALVIENKNWRGVVFDEVHPGSVHASWGALISSASLPATFAIRIAPENEDGVGLESFIKVGREAPRSQVRLQAKRLSTFLRERLGETCWLHTSVFYSHSDVHLYAEAPSRNGALEKTPVAAGRAQLSAVIARFHRSAERLPASPALTIAPVLGDLGADLTGFGSYADRWVSSISDEDARSAQRAAAQRAAAQQAARQQAAPQRAARMQNSLPSGSASTTHDSSPA